MNKFKGTGVALVTPFAENGKVDYNGLEKLVEFQISNGVNYLVVQGTTGESVTLNDEEKVAVLEYIVEINAKRLPILFGVGGNNTAEITEKIKYFSSYEIDGFLSGMSIFLILTEFRQGPLLPCNMNAFILPIGTSFTAHFRQCPTCSNLIPVLYTLEKLSWACNQRPTDHNSHSLHVRNLFTL